MSASVLQGGSPWGAGTLAGPDGSRQPSAVELEQAVYQVGASVPAKAQQQGTQWECVLLVLSLPIVQPSRVSAGGDSLANNIQRPRRAGDRLPATVC